MASFLRRDLAGAKKFKAKLKAGEVATLCHSSFPVPNIVERLGQYGFDAVLLDAEHGSISRDMVENMSRAAALAGTCAIIRPEGSQPHLVTGYLGCGVDGLMLPVITSYEQAKELVYMAQFSAPLDYDDRPLILMIETIQAVEDLPRILTLEGVDAFLVAQADLALSMDGVHSLKGRYSGGEQPWPPHVQKVIDRAINTIVDAGKVCGARVTYDNMGHYLSQGVTLLYDHADHMLKMAAKQFNAKIATDAAAARAKRAAS